MRTPRPGSANLPLKYRIWLAGALASMLGDTCLYFALGWSASERGGTFAALVLTMVNLPRTALLLVGGVLGDRLGARRIMIGGDATMLVAAVILAVVALTSDTPAWVLLATGLVIGTVDAFYLPASGSMPRRLVAVDALPRALALRQTGSQLVTLAGAPLGGMLVVLAGLGGVAVVDAGTFGVVLIVLIAIRSPAPTPTAMKCGVLREAADGIKLSLTDPVLRPALAVTAAAAGFLLPVGSLLVPLLARSHGWAAATAGWTVGSQSLGIIVVAVSVVRFGHLGRPGVVTALALPVAAGGTVALSFAASAPFAIAGAALVGVGSGLLTTHLGPLLLGTAPQTHLSRVQSLLTLVQSTTLLVMNNVVGGVAHWAGPQAGLLLCAGVLVVVGALSLRSFGLRTAVLA